MKSYSLLSLLLFCTVVALCVSHLRMSRQLADAQAELDSIRRNYGYVRVTDDSKIYVSSIAQHRDTNRDSLRFVVPPGDRYVLHLSETTARPQAIPPKVEATTTVALNGWKDGADEILSYSIGWDPDRELPKLRVHTQTDDFYTFVPADWPRGVSLMMESRLETGPQKEFARDETIVLMFARAPSLDRGVLLWLEPVSKWEARGSAETDSTEPSVGR